MPLLNSGESLVKFVANKVKGFEVRRIDAVSGIYVTDVNGYIGIKINDYFSQNGSPYPGNYALVARGPDYSSMGLGRVTFLEYESHVIGGKSYRCVTMPDGKVWMAENLDYKFCNIGGSGDPTTPNAWYYNNDESTYGWNGYKCGLLYNWYAAKFLNDSRSELCPGWHVPTDSEWSDLITACGASTAGTKLKALDNSIALGLPSGWNGTDDYGFSVLPVGYRLSRTFQLFGASMPSWTCSDTIQYYLTTDSSSVGRSDGNSKVDGFSLRLVRDAT